MIHDFFSRKAAEERQGVIINNAISHEHDIPYSWTFHTMATRSFARWPTEFKRDVSSLWKLILYRASKLSHWDRGTRNEVTEGVDKNWQERGQSTNNGLSTPSPLHGTPPVSGGELASAMELKHDVDGWRVVTERV